MRAAWILPALLLAGCHTEWEPGPGRRGLEATIADGRTFTRQVMADTGAASVSVALVDGRGLLWAEAFGTADKGASRAATPATLYGACSVSKLFAAASVMALVDDGKVALDEPVVTYLPAFTMPLDPRHRDITVRMLINHSSGLPSFEKGSVTRVPDPGYGRRALEGMALQRLAHAPGAIGCYNNDGFTLVQPLVEAVTGRTYQAFVRERFLEPLGMASSQYLDVPVPEGTLARAYGGEAARTAYAFNMYGSGGLFSTPAELSRLGSLLLNGGTWQGRRILSAASVAAMAQDQRLGSFNPVPNDNARFGLGWDTVASPGFAGLGIRAWQKGGDLPGYYGTNILVLPDEGLAAVVFGASGSASGSFGSSHATKICERVVLKALVERGRLKAMPAGLGTADLPVQAPDAAAQAAFAGAYGSSNGIVKVAFAADGTLGMDMFSGGTWVPVYQGWKLRSDGWYAQDGDPVNAVRILARGGANWLAQRQQGASGHYSLGGLMARSLEARSPLSAAWQARLDETWLPVDKELFVDYPVKTGNPAFRIQAVAGLDGYAFGTRLLRDMTPASGARLDGFFQEVPDAVRGLMDIAAEDRAGQVWIRAGAYLYRPLSGIPVLGAGTVSLPIGAEGLAEWRRLPAAGTLSVRGAVWWGLYGADLEPLASGFGDGNAAFSGEGAKVLVVYGAAGGQVQAGVV